jgi:hypothetical protein
LKEEALDRTMCRNHFGGDFEPVVRQNTEWMNFRALLAAFQQFRHTHLFVAV